LESNEMERSAGGLNRMVAHAKDAVVPADDVTELSPDDDAWLGKEPSATPDISWIEDDLQKTPVDEIAPVEAGPVPFSPELALTPPPATRRPSGTPIRRPVIERVRPREEIRQQARIAPRPQPIPQPRRVSVEVVPVPGHLFLAYAGAIAAGIASGAAVLFFGQ
jgi:hypothetical protein